MFLQLLKSVDLTELQNITNVVGRNSLQHESANMHSISNDQNTASLTLCTPPQYRGCRGNQPRREYQRHYQRSTLMIAPSSYGNHHKET